MFCITSSIYAAICAPLQQADKGKTDAPAAWGNTTLQSTAAMADANIKPKKMGSKHKIGAYDACITLRISRRRQVYSWNSNGLAFFFFFSQRNRFKRARAASTLPNGVPHALARFSPLNVFHLKLKRHYP